MHQAEPTISVIMATYNHARTIDAALTSILQQAYARIEIIVIDDGATDETPEIVQRVKAATGAAIRYVRQANAGLPAAHNRGLRLAQGEIIAFLDSDDLWPPERLPAQLACFHQPDPAGRAPALVLGRMERFADTGAMVNPRELAAVNSRPVHFALGSTLFRRHLFTQIGAFDESLLHTADWDWFLRARQIGLPFATDPRVTLRVRIHAGNMTQNRAIGNHFTIQMIRQHMARQSLDESAAAAEGSNLA